MLVMVETCGYPSCITFLQVMNQQKNSGKLVLYFALFISYLNNDDYF